VDERSGRTNELHPQGGDGVALLGRTLRRHLADFVAAYNFVRRFKLLKGLTPYKYVCKA
jgi:hypothetical protein